MTHATMPIASEARDATARPYAGRHRLACSGSCKEKSPYRPDLWCSAHYAEWKMGEGYECPQCGPDSRGWKVHGDELHTWPPRSQPDPDPDRCPGCGHPYGCCDCLCCYDDHAGLVPDGIGWGHE